MGIGQEELGTDQEEYERWWSESKGPTELKKSKG